MSDKKHLIWSSDTGTLDDWKDAIYEALVEGYGGLGDNWREATVNNAWEEKVQQNVDYYDNMLVKDFKAARQEFIDNYDYQPDVDKFIEENETECWDYIRDLNNNYLGDEQLNLSSIKPQGRICIFGYFVSWNGKSMLASVPDELVDVSSCLKLTGYMEKAAEVTEYYVENGDFVCYEGHHDSSTSRNKYYFREFPADMTDEEIKEVFNKVNKSNDFSALFEATESLAPEICKVYGWNYEPNEYDIIQPLLENGRK